jgi:hypothetical protein
MRLFLLLLLFATPLLAAEPVKLEYTPASAGNPLKGLVPYAGDHKDRFPHSLEFNYLAYAALVKGYDEFDWKPMEKLLNEIAGRGHQAVFRIYIEYPGKKDCIPEFLIKDGLKVNKWLYTETQPEPPAPIETPDYEDKNLRKSLKNFIAAMGKKYDGDPRIGFITAGLLGTWGEWHTYPKDELFASKTVQAEVMDAYEAAFKITPVLLRYPANEKTWQKAANAKRNFGYHDDSFAWATLDTGKKDDNWFYMPALKAAGALDKWKTQPIGGEIRPEAWGHVFDEKPKPKEVQNFAECVKQTHASWLMDSGMFVKKQSKARIERATKEVQRMGYEFHISSVAVEGGNITLTMENRGVAPFYYDWPIEFGLFANGKVQLTFKGAGKLSGLLPETKPRTWTEKLDLSKVPAGNYTLLLRVPNKLPKGAPLKFANTTQDKDADGWLSLMEVKK